MKQVLIATLIIAACLFTPACGTIKTDLAALEAKIEAINWDNALKYWQEFVKYANEGLPIVEDILKNNDTTLGKVVTAVNDANSAVTSLSSAITQYKAGTLTSSDLESVAKVVQTNVVAAVNTVAGIKAGGSSVATAPVNPFE